MDDTVTPTSTPDPGQSQPPPKNEPIPTEDSPPQTSFFDKIRNIGGSVFERHGVQFKRGRGRPRADGLPGKLDVPLSAPATALPLGTRPDSANPDKIRISNLVKKCVKAFIQSVAGFADSIVFRKAVQAKYPKPEAQELVAKTTITEGECDAFGELTNLLVEQMALDPKYLPVITAIVITTGVATRYMLTIKTLNAEIEAQRPPLSPEMKVSK